MNAESSPQAFIWCTCHVNPMSVRTPMHVPPSGSEQVGYVHSAKRISIFGIHYLWDPEKQLWFNDMLGRVTHDPPCPLAGGNLEAQASWLNYAHAMDMLHKTICKSSTSGKDAVTMVHHLINTAANLSYSFKEIRENA